MPYLVGASLALAVGLLATFSGLDRDRAFYPTVTIVIASYYALFAVLGKSATALGIESVAILLFLVAAVVGFKRNMWVVVGALCAHAVFDFFHADLIANSGVPEWWPGFCLAYDGTAGSYLALLLSLSRVAARAPRVDAS
jgi:hypothetical protein